MRRVPMPAAVAILALVVVGCGQADLPESLDASPAAVEPAPSPEPTPTAPTPAATPETVVEEPADEAAARGNGCQAPALPPPPSGSQLLDDDCISVTVTAGDSYWFDGHQVLQQIGVQAPSCPGFGSNFTWQVTSAASTPMDFFIAPQDVPQDPVSGPSGAIDGYCGTVSAEHGASAPVTFDLRYALLDLCPGC